MVVGGIQRAVLMLALISCVMTGCKGGGEGGSGPATASSGANTSGRPVIQGNPSTVVLQGAAYAFQPIASDSNGDQLRFTATNLPAWLTLNTVTGRITGYPTSGDLGTYSGLTITVSDGSSSSVLGPFSVTVAASGDGSASLAWTPPAVNTDGSQLSDLRGFVVLYGTSPDELSLSEAIDNPSVSRYVVSNLTSGTWYFAVQAVNSIGIRSELSGLATKTIG